MSNNSYKHSIKNAFDGKVVDYIIKINTLTSLHECMQDVQDAIRDFLDLTIDKKVYVVMHVDLLHVASGKKIKMRLESSVEQFINFEDFYSYAITQLENKLEKLARVYTLHYINKIVIKCLSIV